MAVIASAGASTRGLLVWAVMELKQCGDLRFNFQDDIATLATVAAIRAAKGLELLTQNRCAADATIARLRVQLYAIDEGGHNWSLRMWSCGTKDKRGEL
jgi:hypothetical protein